jgi:hypothetical protein
MDPQAFLEGYLRKEADSRSDSIVARYGTKNFRDSYKKARSAGKTTQQASEQAIKASPRVAPTASTPRTTSLPVKKSTLFPFNTPKQALLPHPVEASTPKTAPAPISPKLRAAHASSKRTYDEISNPEQKAQYANKLQSIYTDNNAQAPAWIDPVKSMPAQEKVREYKQLGKDHYTTLQDVDSRSQFVQDTLSNIDRQGLSDTPEWMYDAMRKGQLNAGTEASLKYRYMQTPEHQAAWQRGKDLFDQKMREFNAPEEAPVKKPSLKEIFKPKQQPQQKPSGNLFAGNTSIE